MNYFFIILIALLSWSTTSVAQSPAVAFNQAANLFIEGQNREALQSVNAALQRHPNDARLQALKEKLDQQQKQQQQQQQQQEEKEGGEKEKQEQQQEGEKGEEGKESEEQKQQEGEQKEGEEKEEEKGKEGEEQQEGQNEQEQQEQSKPGQVDTEQRLKEMDISPEKARMILEAMKSNEVQYLQQKKRKAKQRSGNGKPDW